MTSPVDEIYSPEPNRLERGFASYLSQRGAEGGAGAHPSRASVQAIGRVTFWVIGLSALLGLISGGLIGGAEIWVRQDILDPMDDTSLRETLPYWAAFYAFVGVVSALEIALLYALALSGTARVAQHAGLALSSSNGRGLFAHSLARAALEFPSPQVEIYGIDPYAYVSTWKLTVLNLAYKLKVGVSSFILRVFLRRVAARAAIRGVVPLIAAPLYAFWNAFILWRIMTAARIRTLGPFAVDNLVGAHFQSADDPGKKEKELILQAAGEMLARGRDAHPNQIYLMMRLRNALKYDEDVSLNWTAVRRRLHELDRAGQTRVLDVLTASCVIGTRIHNDQISLLRRACADCGATLDEQGVKSLRKAIFRGHQVTVKELSATRRDSKPGAA